MKDREKIIKRLLFKKINKNNGSDEIDKEFNFWRWFIEGAEGTSPGWHALIDIWLINHLVIGLIISTLYEKELGLAANTVLLPITGILIGLSFAWSGSSQALLQTKEIVKLSKKTKAGYARIVHTYQIAILIILSALFMWALAGLGIFDDVWPLVENETWYFVIKAILFTVTSLMIRTCWEVVAFSNQLLLAQKILSENVPSEVNKSTISED